ncbi:MAG: mycofactocin biosynthesis glycosyltransferase MftF [Thermodesulfobacteriota bacterium]
MDKSRPLNRIGNNEEPISPLAYRLRPNVRLIEKKGVLQLCLSYPLKYVSLNPFWREVMDLLSEGDFILFSDILAAVDYQNREKIESFLDDLVRRGFLERTGMAAMETLPFVSVVIPVYNRPHDMAACLDSLLKLDYPKDKLEVIVVDDASTDETPDVVSRYPVKMIMNQKNRQAPYCRNLGAARARGDILAFIDSDCLADRTWLGELVPAFKDPKIAAVGGIVESYYDTRPLDRYEQVRSSLKMGLWPKRSASNNPFFYVPSCNLLVRREVFMPTGGFNESLVVGEDVDLCWRMRDSGWHIDYLPAGRVFHKHRNRVAAFCKRRFDYGTSEPLLNRLYPEKNKQMVFAPWASLFWIVFLAAVLFNAVWLLLFPGAVLLGESIFKFNHLRQKGFDISLGRVAVSLGRSYVALFYHCCAFFSRYYLIWSFIIFPILPVPAIILAGMHLLNGLVEYALKKPKLDMARFLAFFTMEQLSYQLGVWWQCLKLFSFNAVNPRITKPQDVRIP